MKKNDFVLPIIIILLLFFAPASIYGITRYNKEKSNVGNPNHLPKIDNTLYFYSEKDELLGTYECSNPLCERAKTSIDDNVNVHENGESNIVPYVNNEYVFIKDGDEILMNTIDKGVTLARFKEIKDYGVGIADGYYILKSDEDMYALYDLKNNQFVIALSEGYTYMALQGDKNVSGTIDPSKIIVKKEGLNYLIDPDQNELSTPSTNAIYYIEDDYIYYKSIANIYIITDYTLNKIIEGTTIDLRIFNECNVIVDNDHTVRVYSKDYQNIIYEKKYESLDLEYEIKDKSLIITEKESGKFEEISLDKGSSNTPLEETNNEPNEEDVNNEENES